MDRRTLSVLLFLIANLALIANGLRVDSVTPQYGSINGGTRITVQGHGFPSDQFSANNNVTLQSGTRTYECHIHKDGCNSRQVQCYTPKMPIGTYVIKVTIDGQKVADSAHCASRRSACHFTVNNQHTPTIDTLTPSASEPGSLVTVTGKFFSNRYGSNMDKSSNGKTQQLLRVYNGGSKCELRSDTNADRNFGFFLRDNGTSDHGQLTCRKGGIFVGHQNFSMLYESPYGRTLPNRNALKISATSKIYMLQTYAVVNSVSPTSGSLKGGTELTITGNYFDNTTAPPVVRVGNKTCDIQGYVTTTQIKCKTREMASPLPSLFSGGRGVSVGVWNGSTATSGTDFKTKVLSTSAADYSSVNVIGMNYTYPTNNLASGLIVRMQGFFQPPTDSNYTFKLKTNAQGAVFLSTDDTMENKVEYSGAKTAMRKGSRYYIEARMYASTGSPYIRVSMHKHETPFLEDQSVNAKAEYVGIKLSSTVRPEIQTLNLASLETETFQGTSEVQTVTLSSPDPTKKYRLTFYGASTDWIDGHKTASDVQNALKEIPVLSGDAQATVTGTAPNFVVTFPKLFGNVPQMQAVLKEQSGFSVSISTTTEGASPGNSVRMDLEGVPSGVIAKGATAEHAKVAIEKMFTVHCPKKVNVKDATVGSVLSFETAGHEVTEEPFCGRGSKKNPWNIDVGKVWLSNYKYMCFAFKGTVSRKILFAFTVGQSSTTQYRTRSYTLPEGQNTTNEWHYLCLNAHEMLSVEGQVFVHTVRIYRTSPNDLWIDELSFRTAIPYTNLKIVPRMRQVTPEMDSRPVLMESVAVTKTGTDYRVTLTPHNCAHDFKILSVHGVQSTAGTTTPSSTSATFKDSNWGAASSITVQRNQATGVPPKGAYSVTFKGKTINNIKPNFTEDEMRDVLLTASNEMGPVTPSRRDNCSGYLYYIKLKAKGGDQPPMQIDTSGLIGTNVNGVIHLYSHGGLFYDPIPDDMLLRTATKPQVEVIINLLDAKCNGSCQFEQLAGDTPTLGSVSPTSGTNTVTVQISGTGFHLTLANNLVYFGDQKIQVTGATATQLTCQVTNSPGGPQAVTVFVKGKGKASGTATFTYTGSISGISPATGGLGGGINLTISGAGFANNAAVTVGGTACPVLSRSVSSLVCQVPQRSTAGSVAVVVVQSGGNINSPTNFDYSSSLTATVSSINVTTTNAAGGEVALIAGSGFGTTKPVVLIGNAVAKVTGNSDTQVTIVFPPNTQGTHNLVVKVSGKGRAQCSITINVPLSVTGAAPLTGSLVGGTEVTIAGTGFGTNRSAVDVKFGHSPCLVKDISNTQMKCMTGTSGRTHIIDNSGENLVHGQGFLWNPASITIETGDTITWKWRSYGDPAANKYKIQQTESAASRTPVPKGIDSGVESSAGSFSYTFGESGQYYLDAGNKLSNGIRMLSVVNVTNAENKALPLSVKVGLGEATQTLPGSSPSSTPSCSPFSGLLPGCTDAAPTPNVTNRFNFSYRRCLTPILRNLSATQMDGSETLTVTGEGFGTACQTEMWIGDTGRATVANISPTRFTCSLASVTEPVGKANLYRVRLANAGFALNVIQNSRRRHFFMKPHIASISPQQGSLAGGTLLEITGGGLIPNTTVDLDGTPCNVQTVGYNRVTCLTGERVASTATVAVTVKDGAGNNVPATCRASSGNCQFAYQEAMTPKVTSMTPTTVNDAATLTFAGSQLSNSLSEFTVTVGGVHACTVQSSDVSGLTCQLPNIPAGTHSIEVRSGIRGHAELPTDTTLTAGLVLSSISHSEGSTEGGDTVTISGRGFPNNRSQINVTIGGSVSVVKSSSLTSLVCVTPALAAGAHAIVVTSNGQSATASFTYSTSTAATPTLTGVTPTTGITGQALTLSGNFLTGTATVKVNGQSATVSGSTASSISCVAPSQYAGSAPIEVIIQGKGKASGSVTFVYQLSASSVNPTTGGTAGGQNLTVMSSGFNPNGTTVTVCNKACKVVDTTQNDRLVCESPASTITTGTEQCNIVVTVSDQTATITNGFTYDASLTATVTAISPQRGGTAGGTSVTVSGTNFAASGNVVLIGGSPCVVQTQSTTSITCNTGSQSVTGYHNVQVYAPSKGKASGSVEFYYIDVWSSVFTWGGRPIPAAGDLVVIPPNHTVLLDVDTPILNTILIKGGHLIFDRKNITLQASNILITENGSLQVGSEESPFMDKATIILHGHLRTKELPVFGTKVIGVREGRLELHGKPHDTTWTRLATTAGRGTNTITLTTPVTWAVDDYIVIATTGGRHSQNETEKHKIASISTDKKTLTLAENLKADHIAVTETLPNGKTVTMAAEVGLLTRNVVIRGNDDTQWHDNITACPDGFDTGEFVTQTCFQGRFGDEVGTNQFGGQIMFNAPSMNSNRAMGHLSYVELTYMGQAFRLGRYPIHFHLNGANQGSYVRGCAIHQTFNRAINIHHTHHVVIEKNVVYNVMGGALFLEDSIEVNNTFEYNLLLFVKQSTSTLNDDITPAAFWSTNPNNTYRHNVAAGGTHFGFWYRMHEHPIGPSYDENICPIRYPFGDFFNNTVHSQGWFGVWIFEDMYPTVDGACGSTRWTNATLRGLTAWNNEKGFECVNCGGVQLVDSMLVNNEKAGIEGKLIMNSKRFTTDGPLYKDTTIVAKLPSLTPPVTTCTKRGVVMPFGQGLLLDGLDFVNFDTTECSAIGLTTIDGTCHSNCGGYDYHFKNIGWHSSGTRRAKFRWQSEGVLHDLDGTLTGGVAGSKIVPKSALLDPSKCSDATDFSNGVQASKCHPSMEFARFAFKEIRPLAAEGRFAIFNNSFGSLTGPYEKKRLTHKPGYMVSLPVNDSYTFFFESVSHITNLSYTGAFYNLEDNNWLMINHNFTARPDRALIHSSIPANPVQRQIDPNTDVTGTVYIQNATNDLWYLVKNTSYTDVQPNFYRCHFPQCIPPPDPAELLAATSRPSTAVMWSAADSWTDTPAGWGGNNNGVFGPPADGTKVKIPAGTWMVLDRQPAANTFTELNIEGVLEFEPAPKTTRRKRSTNYHDFHIIATYIIVTGRMILGWPDNPMRGTVKITLRGHRLTPHYPIANGPPVGAKCIGAFGLVDIHGVAKATTWTKLAASANAGANTINVQGALDWSINSDIVIATSDFHSRHTEVRRITNLVVTGITTTLTLNESLAYGHIAYSKSYGSRNVDLSAEVGLLTHNVKIEGENNQATETDSLGARILVSRMMFNDKVRQGSLRVSNTEFVRVGQFGWDSPTDPRFAIAFVSSGDLRGNSSIKNCSFHHVYSPAVGVFGSNNMTIEGNVMYRTVGEGIRLEANNIRVKRNFLALMVHNGLYRTVVTKFTWEGLITMNFAQGNNVLQDNALVGSDRAGLRSVGEACDNTAAAATSWSGNVIHACLIGVLTLFDQTKPPNSDRGHPSGCTRLRNMLVYHSYDFGVYFNEPTDVVFENLIVSDNNVGIFPFLIGPNVLTHTYKNLFANVSNSLIIGTSGAFPCDPSGRTLEGPVISTSRLARSFTNPAGGRVGLTWATFSGDGNAAPTMPFKTIMAYPTMEGRHNNIDVTFANFKTSCGKRDAAFTPNFGNDDWNHPVYFKNTRLIDVDDASKVMIHRPNLAKVNPSDCVDMDCDALKQCFIKDLDGGLIGSPGNILCESEFEWGTNPKRGHGDYRIPKVMLSTPDNVRLDPNVVYPNKGILRGSNCQKVPSWNAYKCIPKQRDYHLLVVESLDTDTETRRLSPVAIATDGAPSGQGFVDLINGPQDHGWCAGYTCQKRVSSFTIVIANGTNYLLYFSSVSPDNLRLRLLNNPSSSVSIRVGIFYAKPNRLDVYADEEYVPPLNAEMRNGKQVTLKPTTPNQYMPTISSPLGANFLDPTWRQLYVVVKGSDPVTIRRQKVIVVAFGVPAMTVDEFYGANIVQNLALFLGIPSDKIRIMDVIAETSSGRRKKRATSGVRVTLEIGDPVSNATYNATSSDTSGTSASALTNISNTLVNAAQTGTLNAALNVSVTGVSVQTPAAPTDILSDARTGSTLTIRQPATMKFTSAPNPAMEAVPFNVSVHFLDASGQIVPQLGTEDQPWEAQITHVSGTGPSDGQMTIPNVTVKFVNGYANFSNLRFTRSGSGYVIRVNVVSPAMFTRFSVTSDPITVPVRQFDIIANNPPSSVKAGENFDLSVTVSNKGNTQPATHLNWKSHTSFTISVSFCPSQSLSSASPQLLGTTSGTVDMSTATATISSLSISMVSRYHICVNMTSTPSGYQASKEIIIEVYPVGYTKPTVQKTVAAKLRFTNSYDLIRNREEYFKTTIFNQIAFKYMDVVLSGISVSEGSIIVIMIIGGTPTTITTTLNSIHSGIKAGTFVVTHNGVTYTTDGTLLVDGVAYNSGKTTGPTTKDTSLTPGTIAAIVVCCILAVGIAAAILVYLYYRKNLTAVKGKVDDSSRDVKSFEDGFESRPISPFARGTRSGSINLEVGSLATFKPPTPVNLLERQVTNLSEMTGSSRPTSPSSVKIASHGDVPEVEQTPAVE